MLAQRAEQGALRALQVLSTGCDLCSNDYLGVARRLSTRECIERVLAECQERAPLGATGSRLVSGTTEAHLDLEAYLASVHRADSALLFGSGYEANVGLLSSVARRSDTILYDELVHASMRDGVRLGVARNYSFAHNDVADLRRKISQASGEVYVAVESIYSMDGHRAPLAEIVQVCRETGAYLIVDEAHSTGIYGTGGAGLAVELGLEGALFARVHTFGKAVGFRGACVVGSREITRFLVNFARPFIYSTACDLVALAFMREAYRMVQDASTERAALFALLEAMRELKREFAALQFVESESAIQGVIVPGNRAVVAAERALQEAGFQVKAIRSPTVPEGSERLRLSLHSYNTVEELRAALAVVQGLRLRGHGV